MKNNSFFKHFLIMTSVFVMCSTAHAVTSKSHKAKKSVAIPYSYNLDDMVNNMNRKANSGVIVRSAQTGAIYYQNNAKELLSPASNMKVMTSFAALKYLGPDFVFRTRLMTDAANTKLVNGILPGNLYLKYDGDPTLDFNDLNKLFANLRQQGVRTIQGNFYIDTSRYDNQGVSPGTAEEDPGYCYGAPVSSAILNRNCVTFKVFPGKLGTPARLSGPYDVSLPVINSVVTSASRNCRLSLSKPNGGKYVLDGCISPRRGPIPYTITIPSDSQYGQNAGVKLLNKNGIKILGNNIPWHPENQTQVIQEHDSDSLSVLVVQMMKKSDNLIANTLFKTLGATYTKQSATWQNSAYAEKSILQQSGVDITGMQIIDGSGLSRDNRVSPDQFSQVLMAAYKDPRVSPVYLKALPVGGLNGTLKNRLGSKDIIGKVKAKTGSMHGVSSLSGYIETKTGEVLVFSIIVNDFSGGLYPYRLMEDNICRALRAKY